MSELSDRFAAAAEESKTLSERPSNDDMLRLYALYKQGSVGPVSGDRPGMMDFVGRAKYDAWADLGDMSQDDAMTTYVELVESLKTG